MSLIEFMTGEGLFKVSDGRIKERSDQSSIAGDKKTMFSLFVMLMPFLSSQIGSQTDDKITILFRNAEK